MRQKIVSVKDFGAQGNGNNDDTKAIQDAFNSGICLKVLIPYGNYKVSKTLMVSSNTEIIAHPMAVIFAAGEEPKKRGDFLLSNKDTEKGNENISINGGVWDGNNKGKYNKKGQLFDIKWLQWSYFKFC